MYGFRVLGSWVSGLRSVRQLGLDLPTHPSRNKGARLQENSRAYVCKSQPRAQATHNVVHHSRSEYTAV